jgi:hypothetical protein
VKNFAPVAAVSEGTMLLGFNPDATQK